MIKAHGVDYELVLNGEVLGELVEGTTEVDEDEIPEGWIRVETTKQPNIKVKLSIDTPIQQNLHKEGDNGNSRIANAKSFYEERFVKSP